MWWVCAQGNRHHVDGVPSQESIQSIEKMTITLYLCGAHGKHVEVWEIGDGISGDGFNAVQKSVRNGIMCFRKYFKRSSVGSFAWLKAL